jgi:phage baseplate assembly protein W
MARYTDINLLFTPNPITEDLTVVSDDRAIGQSLKNLILTDFHERPFAPFKGGNIRAMLFENPSTMVTQQIKTSVQDTIKNYEPRVLLDSVVVDYTPDEHAINITIYYTNRLSESIQTVTIILDRIV